MSDVGNIPAFSDNTAFHAGKHTKLSEEFDLQSLKNTGDKYIPSDKSIPQPAIKPPINDPNIKRLDSGWKLSTSKEKPDANDASWQDTKVPGQWAQHGGEFFMHGGNVWYMKKFNITPDMTEDGKKLHLEFKGVDYEAEVYLNDKKLGEHEGYFTPFKFDVTDKIKKEEQNILQIKVTSDTDKGAPWVKKQIKGIFAQHDARPGGSQSKSNIGNTGGIWNDVLLEKTGLETIENTFVTSELSDDLKTAKLNFNYTFLNHDKEPKDVTLMLKYAPEGSQNPEDIKTIEKDVHLNPGKNKLKLDAEEKDPKLWWTWDHGEPNLYNLETTVKEGDEVSHKQNSSFGIRKLEFDEKSRLLKINNKPIFQRGTNYIPTQWLSSYGAEDYKKDISMMKDANLNAVRVHAHILPDEFYSAADRQGMLVYADFPLIWGVSPDSGTVNKAKSQYKEFIENYREHPSIWLWNAHNESIPYDFFLDRSLKKTGESLDPTRVQKGDSGFTDHFYPGWYNWYGKRYVNINRFKPKMPTEYGAQGIPKSSKEFIPQSAQWPMNKEIWQFHDYQPKENQAQLGKENDYSSLDEYIEKSQIYQYDLNRYVTEYMRRNKYEPTTGIYQFMFKEAWPSVTWAVTDYSRQPKMAYEALKESMAPTMVSIDWNKNKFNPGDHVDLPLWLVNDKYENVDGAKINWKIFKFGDEEQKPLSGGTISCNIPEDSAKKYGSAVYDIPEDAKEGEKWVLGVELADKNGDVISANDLVFGVPEKDKKPFKYEPVHSEYPPVG